MVNQRYFHPPKKAIVYLVIGGAWGDEGKGKIAAFHAKNANLAIRATGGANAGHTVYYGGNKIALHLIPGGIGYEKTNCLIGQGVVIDFDVLFDEIKILKEYGIKNVEQRLKISGMATVLMPYHKRMDALQEKLRSNKVGTTKRGIGPAYEDKVRRDGLVVYDLLKSVEWLETKIATVLQTHNVLFKEFDAEEPPYDPHELAMKYHEFGRRIKNMVVDGHVFVREYVNNPEMKIVVEGAQAVMLSIETGDRPTYVTSSDSSTNGTLSGAHLSWQDITEVVLVYKGYFSRVGNGPFPTELNSHIDDEGNLIPFKEEEALIGDELRDFAHEYGATTGRPRRVGSFDALVARYAAEVSGATCLCINHIDSIGEFGLTHGGVKLCDGYYYKDQIINYHPNDTVISQETPQPCNYRIFPGWKITSDMKSFEDLPEEAKDFIHAVEDTVGVPVKYIGTGPHNDDLIVRTEYASI